MEYFNTKEEVIDVKLTPEGRRLLSLGKWRPAFYSFHDDDILYDSQYASISESVKTAQTRIEATDRGKAHASTFTGPPLGKSSLLSDYAPAWKLSFKKGEIVNATTTYTGSLDGGFVHIPQIHLRELKYETKFTTIDALDDESIIAAFVSGSDNTIVQIQPEVIEVEFSEDNADFVKSGFEIEIYEVESGTDVAGNSFDELRRLSQAEVDARFTIAVDSEISETNEVVFDASLGVYSPTETEDDCKI